MGTVNLLHFKLHAFSYTQIDRFRENKRLLVFNIRIPERHNTYISVMIAIEMIALFPLTSTGEGRAVDVSAGLLWKKVNRCILI